MKKIKKNNPADAIPLRNDYKVDTAPPGEFPLVVPTKDEANKMFVKSIKDLVSKNDGSNNPESHAEKFLYCIDQVLAGVNKTFTKDEVRVFAKNIEMDNGVFDWLFDLWANFMVFEMKRIRVIHGCYVNIPIYQSV